MKIIPVNSTIYLKPLTLDMSAEIHDLIRSNYDHLAPWFEWLTPDYSEKDTIEYLNRNLPQNDRTSVFNLGIMVNEIYAGTVGTHGIHPLNNSTSLGYYLGKEYEGKGIMMNSVKALIHYLYDELKIERLEIRCNVENKKSRSIPERLGFQLEGNFRNAELVKGIYRDWAVYGMISDDYKKNKDSLLKVNI